MSSFERKSIWLCRLSSSLLLGIAVLFPLKLLGAEQSAPQTQQSDRFDSMEAPRDYLSGKIASFANYIDRFFGGDRHYQESNQSVIQLDLTRVTGYGGDRKFNLPARANVRLPATEGRLHLLVETNPENNITDQPIPGPIVPTQSQPRPGLRGDRRPPPGWACRVPGRRLRRLGSRPRERGRPPPCGQPDWPVRFGSRGRRQIGRPTPKKRGRR